MKVSMNCEYYTYNNLYPVVFRFCDVEYSETDIQYFTSWGSKSHIINRVISCSLIHPFQIKSVPKSNELDCFDISTFYMIVIVYKQCSVIELCYSKCDFKHTLLMYTSCNHFIGT